jgi:hypothetical protein
LGVERELLHLIVSRLAAPWPEHVEEDEDAAEPTPVSPQQQQVSELIKAFQGLKS